LKVNDNSVHNAIRFWCELLLLPVLRISSGTVPEKSTAIPDPAAMYPGKSGRKEGQMYFS